MRFACKIAVFAVAVALVPSIGMAETVGQLSDLSIGWVGRTHLAENLIDSQGYPQWAAGWQEEQAYSAGMQYTMAGWGWDDAGANDLNQSEPDINSPLRYPVATGYAREGSHDVGWQSMLGFEVTGVPFKVRSTADTTAILQYTVRTTGTYSFSFGAGQAHNGTYPEVDEPKYFGVYSVADGLWLGTNTYNPENGESTLEDIDVSFTDVATAGDKYLIAWHQAGNGNEGWIDYGSISLDSGSIPEPSTLMLLACGLAGLLAYAWRKRK